MYHMVRSGTIPAAGCGIVAYLGFPERQLRSRSVVSSAFVVSFSKQFGAPLSMLVASLTANAMTRDRDPCLAASLNEIASKLFDPDEFSYGLNVGRVHA